MSQARVPRGILALALVVASACRPTRTAEGPQADPALDAVKLGCVLGIENSGIKDAARLAQLCNAAPILIPIIGDLIGVRDGALRAGVAWQRTGSTPDGGPPDAGR